MLTSRRDLLRIFAAATAVGATTPAALAITTGDSYWNRRLRLELQKPTGWHFWSTLDFHAAAKQQVLSDDTPPEAEAILRNPEAAPFLVLAKKHPKAAGVSSAVCLYDEVRDETYPAATPCIDEALAAYSRFLVGVSIIRGAIAASVPGALDAASAQWEFDLDRTDGQSCRVSVSTLLSYRPGRMQTCHFMAVGSDAEQDALALQACQASFRYSDA